MRKGWEYKKLGEVCDVINGYAFKSSKYTSQGTRIIRITNVQKGYVVDNDPKFYSDEDFKDLFQYSLFEGDLVMSLTGNVGRVGILQKNMLPAALNQRVACLRVKSEKMQLNYLFHLLNSNLFENAAIQSARGIAQLNMSTEWLKNYIIPLPPLSTQLAIVSELDKINELIRLKKEQLKDFDNLAQSLFYEMFGDPMENEKGWEVKKLGEIGEVKTGNTPSRSNDNFYNEKFIEWIKTDNIRNEQMNPTTAAEYLSREGAECGRIVSKGSILVACIAGSLSSLGKCCITTKNVAFNQQINAITPYGDFCNSIYLYELIRNSYKYIQQNATTGMKHILSKSIFEKMKFPFPPLPLQRLFAQRIEQIEREKSEVQKSIQDLETLLASRMQYWFE